MKLIDILDLIPEEVAVCVELYDEKGEMFYGYIVCPQEDRGQLEPEHDCQIIDITPGIVRHVNFVGDVPAISIAVRHPLNKES